MFPDIDLLSVLHPPVCWEFVTCLHWETWNDVALENQYLLVDSFPLSCNEKYLERVDVSVPWIDLVLCLLTDVYQTDGLFIKKKWQDYMKISHLGMPSAFCIMLDVRNIFLFLNLSIKSKAIPNTLFFYPFTVYMTFPLLLKLLLTFTVQYLWLKKYIEQPKAFYFCICFASAYSHYSYNNVIVCHGSSIALVF